MPIGTSRDEALAAAGPRRSAAAAGRLGWAWLQLRLRFADAIRREAAERRFFLWLPAAAGAGVLLYMAAEREPVLWMPAALAAIFATAAIVLRGRPVAFGTAVALAAVFCGFFSAGWRSARVAAPVLDRFRFAHLSGYIEQMDFRRVGARFVLRVESADELAASAVPYRVRLTTRRTPEVEAGAFVKVTARLLPPAQAALPGGYSFARDAFFARIGAVGSVPGRIVVAAPPRPPDFMLSAGMALDRARNALARRVYEIIGGDAGAIAAAMVTGKRDLLSEDAKTLIRQAGIFHIITISGVQMTLVAGILFVTIRRLLACSRTLALRYPIKKWAACGAIAGAIAYDIATGSRVGTERALYMTMIVLGSVLVDRRALTMRNLAYAALAVIAFEPEAILGASFQLSFAAVAALVAVFEAHTAARQRAFDDTGGLVLRPPPRAAKAPGVLGWIWTRLSGTRRLLFATLCATSATASFMAFNFHDLSPYVLIGNPLTLALIEFFAVPGALIGAALYPLGLDGFVWHYLGFGISFIMWVASHIAAAPGSTIHLNAFAPWAILFLALAVLSIVIWRSPVLRLTALPLLAIGLAGAANGPRYDVVILPTGDAVAIRGSDGRLGIVAPRTNAFAAEQWLSADGDSSEAAAGRMAGSRCDRAGCTAPLADGRVLSLVLRPEAFEEDCERAAVIVTKLTAPSFCTGKVVVDAPRLRANGATALTFGAGTAKVASARTVQTDRPWMPALHERQPWQPRAKEETSEDGEPSQ